MRLTKALILIAGLSLVATSAYANHRGDHRGDYSFEARYRYYDKSPDHHRNEHGYNKHNSGYYDRYDEYYYSRHKHSRHQEYRYKRSSNTKVKVFLGL